MTLTGMEVKGATLDEEIHIPQESFHTFRNLSSITNEPIYNFSGLISVTQNGAEWGCFYAAGERLLHSLVQTGRKAITAHMNSQSCAPAVPRAVLLLSRSPQPAPMALSSSMARNRKDMNSRSTKPSESLGPGPSPPALGLACNNNVSLEGT